VKLWLDQMLPRRLCDPIREWTGCEVSHVGTQYLEDADIFEAARAAGAVVVSKDSDFLPMVRRLGAPPQFLWLRCGNCSNRELERILEATLGDAIRLLRRGEPIVEITGAFGAAGSTE
jgi:predicted nuclease of predicted toxin-antitoxin system